MKPRHSAVLSISGAVLVVASGYPLCASAQTVTPTANAQTSTAASVQAPAPPSKPTAAPAAEPQTLPTIVVTAQYHPERLNNVAASVSTFTGTQLQSLGAQGISGFAAFVPGLTFSSLGAGTNTLIMRGINTGGFEVTPLVGVMLDGVPYGSSSSFADGGALSLDASLWDLRRIEVLKGPQGTLYGANAMTGLVSYIYNDPNLEDYQFLGETDVSSTQNGRTNYVVHATVNLPLVSDRLALRASVSRQDDAGFIDNPLLGETDVNGNRSHNARVSLLFKPNDRLSIKLEGIDQHTVRDAGSGVLYSTVTDRPVAGSLDSPMGLLDPASFDARIGALTVDYDFGPATLTSITSDQTVKGNVNIDYTGTPTGTALKAFGADNTNADLLTSTRKFTQELRLTSNDESALRYVAGLFYTDEKAGNNQVLDGFSASGAPVVALNPILTVDLPSTYREYAAFGQATYAVTSNLFFTAGARYSHDQQAFSQSNGGLLGPELSPVPESSSGEGEKNYTFSVRYAIAENSNVYVTASSGYRPGGPNVAIKGSGAPPVFQPDRLWNYETGYKATLLDGRLDLQADAYYIAWSHIQLLGVTASGFSYRANGGDASSKGLEAQGTFRPFEGMTVGANFALTDAKLDEAAPLVGGAVGERLPYSPRWSGAVFANYEFPIWTDWTGFAGLTVQAVGNRTTSFNGSATAPQFTLSSYVMGNLSAGIRNNHWKFTAYIHNVGNERAEYAAYTQYLTVPQQALVTIAQPRTIGLTVDVKL